MEWTKKKPVGGSRYGLQLKISAPATKKPQLKKPVPFSLDDDEEYTVEDDIARQASKKQSAHEVDVQIKQALEQDANAFDYDGVYDQMKGQQAQPIREDRAKREPKYIKKLIDKAKVRTVEHDMAYERRLAKEREKEDHLYGDKDTFVTSTYKKKLMEMGKWKEEERLRELREQAHEVSGKKDLSDFYRNLLKHNVAFGAGKEKDLHREAEGEPQSPAAEPEASSKLHPKKKASDDLEKLSNTSHRRQRDHGEESESASPLASDIDHLAAESPVKVSISGTNANLPSKDDAVATARERYLARKNQQNPDEVSISGAITNLPSNTEQNPLTGPPKVDGFPPSAPSGDKKSDAVASARERYLARKKQRDDRAVLNREAG